MAAPAITLLLSSLLFLSIFSGYKFQLTHAQQQSSSSPGLGINYGQIANNLPTPTQVANLLKSISITRVKLYDYNPTILTSFANTNIQFTIGIPNNLVPSMSDPTTALNWIKTNIQPYTSKTLITSITVGNEILTGTDQNLINSLLPAMKSVHSALTTLGLNSITVSSANSVAILSSSFPPSSGAFQSSLSTNYILPLLAFHSQTNSPFLINAYPFFSYMADPITVSLDYVLFRPNATGTTDPKTNLHYDNMLYAQIDAVYTAIKSLGFSGNIKVQISETGWPSKGDENEIGATIENAKTYNGNLLKRVVKGEGTPAMPNVPIDVYVFALFNENEKPGPDSERNYGLYYPNVEPVYDVGIQQLKEQGGSGGNLPQFYSSGMYYSSAGISQWRRVKKGAVVVPGDGIMSWMVTTPAAFITFLHFLCLRRYL